MTMMTDIEIARSVHLKKIIELARDHGFCEQRVFTYGRYMAKLSLSLIDNKKVEKSNLVLVTAISPTKAGIGKTTVSIGLSLGLNKLGKSSIVALREPSLGPCFGMKGGAAGGGYAQVLPMEDINLHFTGDFHAITTAHNMITALLDNYIYQNRKTNFRLKEVLWKRVLDINDRSLRHVITGLHGDTNGIPSESGFDITPASEIMAIVCLSESIDDLKRRIENIILGYTFDRTPFTVKDLGVAGAIVVLLKDAINPNLVQTTENTLSIIHGGPFANIAHGCNSVVATKMAMSHADYVVTEAGFGADLGAEKFFNIKCRKAGLKPKLTVVVATIQALKMHGGVDADQLKTQNVGAVRMGLDNLNKHVDNMRSFGQTVIVVLNKYMSDTQNEIDVLKDFCQTQNIGFSIHESYTKGGEGALELAELVVKTIDSKPSSNVAFTYHDEDTIEMKIEKVAKTIYGASSVEYNQKALRKLNLLRGSITERYPICIAKTQYSFSDDSSVIGVGKNFRLTINDIFINNGAEFIVAIAGSMVRMPGLPKVPQANQINLIDGFIEGLY